MVVHLIVDYSFLYYKYKFQLASGKLRRLTAPIYWNGTTIDKDISQIYYTIKEIEGFRKKLEQVGHNTFVSICFDMPSARKEIDSAHSNTDEASNEYEDAAVKYKSNRFKRLTEEDFENIRFAESLLSDAGHNTYRFDRYEADDIIAELIHEYSNAFDYSVIYTSDLDLLAHIKDNVGVSRYKVKSGYTNIDKNTFSAYVSQELKCNVPYNGLVLLKATVGDSSDCIDGIKKFGPKAFDKLVEHLNQTDINWEDMANPDKVLDILNKLGNTGYLSDEQLRQAKASLSLVRPMKFNFEIPQPVKHSTRELRAVSYMRCQMQSLID